MGARGIGRDRRRATLRAHDRGGEDRRRRQQAQRGRKVIAVREPRDQRAHRVERRECQEPIVQCRDLAEHFAARPAERARHLRGVRDVGEEAREQQLGKRLERGRAGERIERVPADDQPAVAAVDLRQHRVGRDHALQSIGCQSVARHLLLRLVPNLRFSGEIGCPNIDVNLDGLNQYASTCGMAFGGRDHGAARDQAADPLCLCDASADRREGGP